MNRDQQELSTEERTLVPLLSNISTGTNDGSLFTIKRLKELISHLDDDSIISIIRNDGYEFEIVSVCSDSCTVLTNEDISQTDTTTHNYLVFVVRRN